MDDNMNRKQLQCAEVGCLMPALLLKDDRWLCPAHFVAAHGMPFDSAYLILSDAPPYTVKLSDAAAEQFRAMGIEPAEVFREFERMIRDWAEGEGE